MPEDNSKNASEEDLRNVHQQALKEFSIDYDAQYDERRQSIEDRRFASIPGAQYEDFMGDTFDGDNKLKIEVNKVQRSLIRIHDEYINNRIAVDFISQDGANADELADLCDGLMRADEQDSNADEAYDNSFDEGSAGGFGAFRYRSEYEDPDDDENERQRIRIEPIFEADSCVYFDASARRQDKSDAKRCFVLIPMSVDDYIEEYDDDPASWPKDLVDSEFDWATPDMVYLAEYYKEEKVSETIHIYKLIDATEERYSDADFKADEELETKLLAEGSQKVREKKISRKRVKKYLMSGGKVLEDCGYVAGRNIPVSPFYGKRWFISGIERFMGHVRLAKDVQRLANVLRSKLGELAASGSQETPIFDPSQIDEFVNEWEKAALGIVPYLRARALKDDNGNIVTAGPIGYTKAPEIPPALAALMAVVEQDLKDILGDNQGAEKIVSGISGKTVDLIQQRLDMQAFIYISNMGKAKKRGGEIWLSMAKELYIEPSRKMKTVTEQGKTGQIELNIPIIGEEGEDTYQNDISHSSLGLAVEIGPSSSSKKSATVTALTGMMQVTTDPEDLKVLSAMIMMNMEGEGLSDTREYYRQKLIRMGVVKPNKEEQEQLAQEVQNQQPDANTEYLQAAAQTEQTKAERNQAETALTMTKIENTQADTEKKQAETIETLSDVDREDLKTAKELLGNLDTGTASPQVGVEGSTATTQPDLGEV